MKMSKPFKAVEFMRDARQEIERQYQGLDLLERENAMRKDLEKSPLWQSMQEKFSQRRMKHAA
ncbi:MAG: hypothetical protein HYT87_08250 [Nitrospirae bacterium]|nr:hypothetical protein [Nitrospirota bacterium]